TASAWMRTWEFFLLHMISVWSPKLRIMFILCGRDRLWKRRTRPLCFIIRNNLIPGCCWMESYRGDMNLKTLLETERVKKYYGKERAGRNNRHCLVKAV